MYVCMYVFFVCKFVRMYVRISECIQVCVYVFFVRTLKMMYVCMYVCTTIPPHCAAPKSSHSPTTNV